MARTYRLTLRMDQEEKRLLRVLTQRLQRTQGDTLRLLVREAAGQLAILGRRSEPDAAPHGDDADGD